MKKNQWLLLAMLAAIVLLCSACGADNGGGGDTADTIPVILNQGEYILYQNIFYNDYASRYENAEAEKEGVFAAIYDAFNERTRYYVWGYMDQTKCCDWQWEIVPKSTKNLPPVGSRIKVKGVYQSAEEALDGFWIVNAEITPVTRYTGRTAEVNMLAMSDTLERVQISNIMYKPDYFEGKSFLAYGRILTTSILQDPYYDGSWQIPFSTAQTVPAIGTTVILAGKVQGGALAECAVETLE